MRETTGLKWHKQSVARVTGHLRKLGGTVTTITGRLTEHQRYAVYVEFGTSRTSARPHMRPAWSGMLRRALPILRQVVSQPQGLASADYDKFCVDAVIAAMYEMEALRMFHLSAVVYTAGRYARERVEGYTGYRLTGNLRSNRSILVTAKGAPQLRHHASRHALGAVPNE